MFCGKKGLIVCGGSKDVEIVHKMAEYFCDNGAQLAFAYDKSTIDSELLLKYKPFFIQECDFSSDLSMTKFFHNIKECKGFDHIDFIINDLSFLDNVFLDSKCLSISRESLIDIINMNCYTFIKIFSLSLSMFNFGGSYVGFTHYSAQKWIPGCHLIAIAKAALESSMRYLACEAGPLGVRVNCISSATSLNLHLKSLACEKNNNWSENNSPLKKETTVQDIINTTAYLVSELSSNVTGEILHVDGGYSIMGNRSQFVMNFKESE